MKGLFYVIPLLLASCTLNIQTPDLDSKEQAKFYIKTVARGQENYYKANGQFAASLNKLSLNVDLDTPDYHYSVVSQGKSAQSMVIKAAAKNDDLPSYTGVIYVNKTNNEMNAVVNICQTDGASKSPPVLPIKPIPGKELECPPGSIPVH